jgi:hypothetical protein
VFDRDVLRGGKLPIAVLFGELDSFLSTLLPIQEGIVRKEQQGGG